MEQRHNKKNVSEHKTAFSKNNVNVSKNFNQNGKYKPSSSLTWSLKLRQKTWKKHDDSGKEDII